MNATYLIFPAILLLFAFRIWKSGGRERPVTVRRLWILPVIFGLLIGSSVYAMPLAEPLSLLEIDALGVAFLLGFGCGWLRGRTTHITVDAESGSLKAKTTPIALIFIAVLFLIRISARDWLNMHAEEWNIQPAAVVDAFMLFGLGIIFGWRIEMILRCRRLLRDAAPAEAQ